jgi:hypothetical protein
VVLIRHLARVALGVAFVAASLMLAASGALAHAGHRHHAPQPEAVQNHAAMHVHARTAQRHVHVVHNPAHGMHRHLHGTHLHFHAGNAVPADLAAMQGTPGDAPEKSHDCSGCCCCMGVGHSAAWLALPVALMAPGARALTPEARSDGGAGVTPDALPEPPRTQA